jgi:hypothetical protein
MGFSNHADDDDFVARCLDGRATDADRALLADRLRADTAFRGQWLELATIDARLSQLGESASPALETWMPPKPVKKAASRSWLPFGTRTVAASLASLVVGGVFASAVWAMVGGLPAHVTRLFAESFERGDPPCVTGAPSGPGVWCGDYSEVVGPQEGITAFEGQRMLRFLRGDFAGKPVDEGDHCNVQRLIDLRPYRQLIAKGNAVMRMSARFNGQPSAGNSAERCIVAGHAIGAEVADKGTLQTSNQLLKRALAYSFSRDVNIDGDPDTWQLAVCELRIPPNTDFLLLTVAMAAGPDFTAGRLSVFRGHYCDDVRVSVVEIPVAP